eukprot:scaffold2621_cov187-Skeletonema_marinoi.AAC.9
MLLNSSRACDDVACYNTDRDQFPFLQFIRCDERRLDGLMELRLLGGAGGGVLVKRRRRGEKREEKRKVGSERRK